MSENRSSNGKSGTQYCMSASSAGGDVTTEADDSTAKLQSDKCITAKAADLTNLDSQTDITDANSAPPSSSSWQPGSCGNGHSSAAASAGNGQNGTAASQQRVNAAVPELTSSAAPSRNRPPLQKANTVQGTAVTSFQHKSVSLDMPDNGPRPQQLKPRLSQYEINPLLQRNRASGLTEIEELLLLEAPPSRPTASTSSAGVGSGRHSLDQGRLQPRAAHCEEGVLKELRYGLNELETYMEEMQQETARRASVPAERPLLLPRGAHYEKHPLLETLDEQGRSVLDEALHDLKTSGSRQTSLKKVSFEGQISPDAPSRGSKNGGKGTKVFAQRLRNSLKRSPKSSAANQCLLDDKPAKHDDVDIVVGDNSCRNDAAQLANDVASNVSSIERCEQHQDGSNDVKQRKNAADNTICHGAGETAAKSKATGNNGGTHDTAQLLRGSGGGAREEPARQTRSCCVIM